MIDLDLTEPAQNARVYGLVKELDKRIEAIIKHYPEDFAFELLPHLQSLAPQDIEDYAQALEVIRVKLTGVDSVAGIIVPNAANKRRLTQADVQRTVLDIHPKIRGDVAMDPGAVVLWRNNPWTMDSLPYEPGKRGATITSRRVSARDAAEIDRRRRMDLPAVVAELRALKITVERKNPPLLEERVVRDLVWEVLRREFGYGDAPHVAHWRPSLHYAQTVLIKQVLKSYLRWLSVPSEKRWKKPLISKPGKVKDVKQVQAFQRIIRP